MFRLSRRLSMWTVMHFLDKEWYTQMLTEFLNFSWNIGNKICTKKTRALAIFLFVIYKTWVISNVTNQVRDRIFFAGLVHNLYQNIWLVIWDSVTWMKTGNGRALCIKILFRGQGRPLDRYIKIKFTRPSHEQIANSLEILSFNLFIWKLAKWFNL